MKNYNRRSLMFWAWNLAMHGARTFGGSARAYFAEALRIAWAEARKGKEATIIYRPGIGSQYWLMPPKQEVRRGQLTLPGMLLT